MRVLIAEVDIDLDGLDGPGRQQHAGQHAMGLALQVVAVLERSRLPFVGVDHHQPGGRLLAHQPPLHGRAEACPPHPAELGLLDGRDQLLAIALAAHTFGKEPIPLLCPESLQTLVSRDDRGRLAGGDGLGHRCRSGAVHCRWPTQATGANSHRPMQGPRTTRAVFPSDRASSARSSRPPNIEHVRLSQTRTVIGGSGSHCRQPHQSGHRTWQPRRPRRVPEPAPRPGPRCGPPGSDASGPG